MLFLYLSAGASTSAGAQEIPARLRGHSIIVDYRESLETPRGPEDLSWKHWIYISNEGNIFHRQSVRSNNPRIEGDREIGGPGDRNPWQLKWTGQGLTRSWPSRSARNVVLTFTVDIEGTRCRSRISREGSRALARVLSENCRIASGNLLKQAN